MSASDEPLRFGLVGTGHWPRITHAPALASAEGIEFAAVWGRDPGAARAAGRSGAPGLAADPVVPLRTALAELVGNVRAGRTAHRCDVEFGQDVVSQLAEAERQLAR